MILILASTLSIVCVPIVAWFMISKAQDKQLDAEVKLDMYQTLYKQFTRDSTLATNRLVDEIIDKAFSLMQAQYDRDKAEFIKNVIIKDVGHLRHLDSTFFALLGEPEYKDEK